MNPPKKRRHFISRIDFLFDPPWHELKVIRKQRTLKRSFKLTSTTNYIPVMEMPASGKITFGNKALYTSFWKLKACWSIKTPPLITKRVSNVVNVNKSLMKSPLLVRDANVIRDIKLPVSARVHTFLLPLLLVIYFCNGAKYASVLKYIIFLMLFKTCIGYFSDYS